jgi:uncharacterized lipoprotein YmbA
MRRWPLHTTLIVSLTMLLAACLSSSPPSRFYTLQAEESAGDAGAVVIGSGWVGVGPIGLPSYLDRPQIVTRGEGHRLVVHEFDRWADPLRGRVLDVLMENVVALSKSKRVTPYPWPADLQPDRRVMGEIAAFEAGPDGEVLMKVRWLVQVPGKPDAVQVHTGEYREAAPPGDFDAIAAAMSRALARWSLDIATALADRNPSGGA